MDVDFALVISGVAGLTCSTAGPDWNKDGVISSEDVYRFVQDFFDGRGDFDADGVHGYADVVAFMDAYFVQSKK